MTAQASLATLPTEQAESEKVEPQRPMTLADAKALINQTIDVLHSEHPDWPMSRLRSEAFEQARPQLPTGIELRSRHERRKRR